MIPDQYIDSIVQKHRLPDELDEYTSLEDIGTV